MSVIFSPPDPAPAAPLLRVTRHGYDTGDVNQLLAQARGRLTRLSERIHRAESANVALVGEVQRWKRRARDAEASREEFERALALAESTATATMTEAQVRADQLVERARCEAEHLVTRARIEARRAHAAEHKALRTRAAAVEAAEARLREDAEAVERERLRLRSLDERWRREVAWFGSRMLAAIAPHPAALPAPGETATDDTGPVDAALLADDAVDRVFARFMSREIEDEPSRGWLDRR